ncbi:MAG: hypothetical protein L0221_12555 [Chloroflexi bacterium]|nr:hypothetical protein [Chloroflexota bacterium]
MDDFVRSIADGIAGLIGGSISAISVAFDTIVGQLQVWLPGPLFPIVVGGAAILVGWWFLKK